MREVLGHPYLQHHLCYLDISFQAKLKRKEGPGKYILLEARVVSAQDRRQAGQAMELCRWHVREISPDRQCPI